MYASSFEINCYYYHTIFKVTYTRLHYWKVRFQDFVYKLKIITSIPLCTL